MTEASTALNSQGLPAPQINALIGCRNEDTEKVASAIREDSRRISETVSRARRNERIRIKLCLYLNLGYEALWGGAPDWNRIGISLRAEYERRFQTAGVCAA